MKTKNNKPDFTGQIIYIGLDVHKKSWMVTIISQGIILKTMSFIPSPEQLVKYLHKNYPKARYISVYEAGFCGFWIHRRLRELGVENIVVNPADVPTKQKERRHKADKIDSRKLTRELSNNNLEGIYIPSKEHESLRALGRLRRQTVKDQTRIKCRIKSLLYFVGIELPEDKEFQYWSGKFIKYLSELEFEHKAMKLTLEGLLESLKKQRQILVSIVKNLREIVKENEKVAKIVKLLQSVPGVAFITAITLYTEIMDINRFSKFDSLSCLIGFSPATDSTGEKEVVLGLSHQQNKYLRAMLIGRISLGSNKKRPGNNTNIRKVSDENGETKSNIKNSKEAA